MKFLLDVCASSRGLQSLLTDRGLDVVSAVALDPRATDEVLLETALAQQRILITEDKGFGELVFARRLPHGTIIRFVKMKVDDQVVALRELLDRYADDLRGNTLITVTPGRIRVRR